jgi:hypothetical protein
MVSPWRTVVRPVDRVETVDGAAKAAAALGQLTRRSIGHVAAAV